MTRHIFRLLGDSADAPRDGHHAPPLQGVQEVAPPRHGRAAAAVHERASLLRLLRQPQPLYQRLRRVRAPELLPAASLHSVPHDGLAADDGSDSHQPGGGHHHQERPHGICH